MSEIMKQRQKHKKRKQKINEQNNWRSLETKMKKETQIITTKTSKQTNNLFELS